MSQYAKRHENSQGPGDKRPTALEIVQDEGLTGKLTDKVFLVTGVSSGIGIETMRALYATGGHVFSTVRNKEKGEKVVEKIKAKAGDGAGKITLIDMAMDSLESIRKGAEEFLSQSKTLNVLVNNAGVMAVPEGKTKDGFETQFGVCHVGHFYLFQLLKDVLLQSSTPDFPSRVVVVASFGHRTAPPRLDDYNFREPGSYDPWAAYGQAKTANIWFSNELERRYGTRGLHSISLHPGGIHSGLMDHLDWQASFEDPKTIAYMKSPEQGAATSIYGALSAEWKDKGGKYLSDCVVQAPFAQEGEAMAVGDDGYAPWAYDEEKEARLWKDSLAMVGMEDDK